MKRNAGKLTGPFVLAVLVCLQLVVCTTTLGAPILIDGPTTEWMIISNAGNEPDWPTDQQTGSAEGDINGNLSQPALFAQFDDNDTPGILTDGYLAFRVRLGRDKKPLGFSTAVFIYLDADNDGATDIFIGVNNSGSADKIGIWDPGSGLNTSPNTTTIGSTYFDYTQTSTNYDWAPVTTFPSGNDPGVGNSTDLDSDGNNDHFISFMVPFGDVVSALNSEGISGYNQNTVSTYVLATATQANSLNQDLSGPDDTYDPDATWEDIGAGSNPVTPAGGEVPEPATMAILVAGGFGILLKRRRHR